MPLDFVFPDRSDASVSSFPGEFASALNDAVVAEGGSADAPVLQRLEGRPVPVEAVAARLGSALEAHLRGAAAKSSTQEPRQPSTPSAWTEPSFAWRGHFQELRQATSGELSRTRHLLEERLDELAQALHSDMRRVREECRAEWEINSSDVFRIATALSHLQDKLMRLESGFSLLHQQVLSLAAQLHADQPAPAAVGHATAGTLSSPSRAPV